MTHVIEVNVPDFQTKVLEESRRRPVVVDFWAPWCGPCRAIGPVLERLAEEGGGRWLLAKLNTDDNQSIALDYQIAGIPAVKAFRNGEVVDEFVGAMPEGAIRSWLDRLVPGPADEVVAAAKAHLAAGRPDEARRGLEQALTLKPRHPIALLELARLDAGAGDVDAALARLERIPEDEQVRLGSEIAELRLALRSAAFGSVEDLRTRLQHSPDDDEARLALGWALAAAADHEGALACFLDLVRRHHRKGPGEEGRRAMVEVFEIVGPRSELAETWRSRLAQELYR